MLPRPGTPSASALLAPGGPRSAAGSFRAARRVLAAVPVPVLIPVLLWVLILVAVPPRPAGAQTTEPGQAAPSLDAFGLLVAEQSRPSFSVVGAGARAAGMGGAFTAVADDASAASFNPAGLALLVRPEASAVLDGRRHHDAYDAFTDFEDGALETYGASSSSFNTGSLNFASFTYPVLVADRNLTFQLSFHRLIDFDFQGDRIFDETSAGTGRVATLDQRVDQDGDVSTLSLAAAYQLTQRLSLGITLSRWIGKWSFSTRTRETALAGDEPTTTLRYSQDNAWSGWNSTLGMLLRYRYLNVGATVRTPFDGDFQVDSRLDTSFESPFEPTSHFSGTLSWPSSFTAGLAIKPLETWFLTADYAEFDWDDLEIRGLADEPVNFFDLQPKQQTAARHSGEWRFGTEVTLFPHDEVIGLRAGYFRVPRPVPMAPPGESDATVGYSLGAGWKHGPLTFDVAYQRSELSSVVRQFVDPETVASGAVEAQAEGTTETSEERVFVSVLYQFDSRASLRRLGHFLFVGPLDRSGSKEKSEKGEKGEKQTAGTDSGAGTGR